MTTNCVVNAKRTTLLEFYIFKAYYMQLCKLRTCMAMQSKAWMTIFLFKEFLFLKKGLYQMEYPNKYVYVHLGWAWIPCFN